MIGIEVIGKIETEGDYNQILEQLRECYEIEELSEQEWLAKEESWGCYDPFWEALWS